MNWIPTVEIKGNDEKEKWLPQRLDQKSWKVSWVLDWDKRRQIWKRFGLHRLSGARNGKKENPAFHVENKS